MPMSVRETLRQSLLTRGRVSCASSRANLARGSPRLARSGAFARHAKSPQSPEPCRRCVLARRDESVSQAAGCAEDLATTVPAVSPTTKRRRPLREQHRGREARPSVDRPRRRTVSGVSQESSSWCTARTSSVGVLAVTTRAPENRSNQPSNAPQSTSQPCFA